MEGNSPIIPEEASSKQQITSQYDMTDRELIYKVQGGVIGIGKTLTPQLQIEKIDS